MQLIRVPSLLCEIDIEIKKINSSFKMFLPNIEMNESNSPDVPDVSVNIGEDIPGCEDNYYRCAIPFWRVSETWFDTLACIFSILSSFIGSIATLGSLSSEWETRLGITVAVCGFAVVALISLRNHAHRSVIHHTQTLELLIRQYRKFHDSHSTQGGSINSDTARLLEKIRIED
jgi:hypothetical protein